MLRFNRVLKYFGERTLFTDASLSLHVGQRVGVVGCNGSGKTTLLQMAAGLVEPDGGTITRAAGIRTAYLEQSLRGDHCSSGGEQQREALFHLFEDEANIWLLDEPTNNLDEDSIMWLERELLRRDVGCLIVSHDRNFLDHTVERILELNPITATCTEYGGNYTFYRAKQSADERHQWRMYNQQQEKFRQLEQDIRETKTQALKVETRTTNDYLRGRAKKVAAKAKARESRLRRMQDLERIDKPRLTKRIRLELSSSDLMEKPIFELRNVVVSIEGQEILRDLNLQLRGGMRIVVSGRNGAGKSTLLKLLTGQLGCHSGDLLRNSKVRLSYLPQLQDHFTTSTTVLEWFERELDQCGDQFRDRGAIRSFLHRFLFQGNDVFKDLRQLSCGERTRLKLAVFMAENPDLLILDEPTNHLDVEAIESIEQALDSFNGAIVSVSHDTAFQKAIRPDLYWHVDNGTVIERLPMEI